MKKNSFTIAFLSIIGFFSFAALSCSDVNTVGDPHFTLDGYFQCDSDSATSFSITPPAKIKYYIEVSGSMNGFFRANQPTQFKTDVWEIMSYFSAFPSDVTILTNNGSTGATMSIYNFRQQMNTGSFVSSASTQVPVMLASIINDVKPEDGEVAVLISDMKYSPVGAAAPKVLMEQYSSDVSRILGSFHKPVSLIAATSNYLDKKSAVEDSPYYYFVIGNAGEVAYMRNCISTLLDNNNHFVDNIESGFDYGAPSYSFGMPRYCTQLEAEPTFVDFDTSESDTCVVNLKVDLAKYRWLMEDTAYFKKAFKCEALYGSNVSVGDVKIDVQNITNRELNRTAVATVELKLYDMAMDSEVIEWGLEIPDLNVDKFVSFFGGVESDPTKSYSLDSFIRGIFYGGVTNKTLKPNYILISKNS